jgi:hypothetical protein
MWQDHYQWDLGACGYKSRSSIFRGLNDNNIKLNREKHSGPIKKWSERKNPIIPPRQTGRRIKTIILKEINGYQQTTTCKRLRRGIWT